MKRSLLFILLGFGVAAQAQKYSSEKSFISFYSHAAIEDISAKNTKANSIFNTATGEVVFSIPIKDFEFAKKLMKEHFNEKYMDTEKLPTSTFQGTITGFQPDASGVQQAKATGKLTIHGVTKEIEIPGTMEFTKTGVVLKAAFIVKLEDYKIDRPQLLWQNIAEQVEVKIEFTYKKI